MRNLSLSMDFFFKIRIYSSVSKFNGQHRALSLFLENDYDPEQMVQKMKVFINGKNSYF